MAINKRSFVDDGDILMPMIGTIGNPVIVVKDRDFAIKNVALIKFWKTHISNIFIKNLLQGHFLERYIEEKSKWGTQKFLSLWDIRDISVPLPPIELQNQFAEIVQNTEKTKKIMLSQLAEMERHFGALMQRSFDL